MQKLFPCVIHIFNLKQPMLASKLNDEYGDTVPSRPHNMNVVGAADLSSHGTMRKLQKVEDVDTSEGLCFLYLICSSTALLFEVGYFLLLVVT